MTQVTNTVRFVFNSQIVEVKGERRTTTVLDYLREQLRKTGTKEGCAEGDCGACVVLVGDMNAQGTGVDYVPVNSCIQLLPTLDGKALKTVESLTTLEGVMHPVQEAMMACHGSQCGFCTPGIVMSLVHMVQKNQSPSRLQITDALSGNLCRCTGYKPIIDAAQLACQSKDRLVFDDSKDLELLKEIRRSEHPTMSLDGEVIVQPVVRTRKGNEFVSPATLMEVAHYMVEHPEATLLAGSSEIGLQVNKEFKRPDHIVYLGHVRELRGIFASATSWRIGAMESIESIKDYFANELPDFSEVLRRFGSPPIRATATLAGNIANGSPIGDSMPCLMALSTQLVLRRGVQSRLVGLDEFYVGQKKTVLQPGEFIEAIEIPKLKPNQYFKAHKVSKRFEQDISATCAALVFELNEGRIKNAKLAYNGLAPSPCRAPKIEQVLEGRLLGQVSASDIDHAIAQSFVARDGLRATWKYRSLVARNLVIKFIDSVKEEESAV